MPRTRSSPRSSTAVTGIRTPAAADAVTRVRPETKMYPPPSPTQGRTVGDGTCTWTCTSGTRYVRRRATCSAGRNALSAPSARSHRCRATSDPNTSDRRRPGARQVELRYPDREPDRVARTHHGRSLPIDRWRHARREGAVSAVCRRLRRPLAGVRRRAAPFRRHDSFRRARRLLRSTSTFAGRAAVVTSTRGRAGSNM